jgi:Arc/MetJ-type ribon-helix-helix transcriptional regulator
MSTAKIAITIEEGLLQRVDRLVKSKVFPNRSKAFQQAVEDKIARLDRSRLARECAKLDPKYEQSLAEEGFAMEISEILPPSREWRDSLKFVSPFFLKMEKNKC